LNPYNVYDIDEHVAELYDQQITETADLAFVRQLIAQRAPGQALRILEPFCGTGRLLLPLAEDGHSITGLDQSQGLLARARRKAAGLPLDVQARITLVEMDVTRQAWPGANDLLLLAANCFYELGEPVQQEGLIRTALDALKPGGWLFIDNDHMEGDLPASWSDSTPRPAFPSGLCADGTRLESSMQTVSFDAPRRVVCLRRTTRVTLPNGQVQLKERMQQKHPLSMAEVRDWITYHTFVLDACWGSYDAAPFTPESPRAIFLAHKKE
jgi:SAM-dependent methyltransferase